MTPRSLLATTALCAALSMTSRSSAQPAGNATAGIARNHIDNGGRYYRLGRFADAAREFQAAYDLTHQAGLLFNLAHALEDDGRDREALDAYQRFEAAGAPGVDRATLRTRIEVVRARLSRAATPPPPPPLPTPPPPVVTPPPPAVTPPPPRVDPPASAPRSLALPVTLFSAGGALLVTGLALGLTVSSTWSDLENRCVGRVCDPSLQGSASAAETRAVVADVLGGIGVAAIAAGVVVLALPRGRGERAPRVGAMCASDGCAGRVTVSF